MLEKVTNAATTPVTLAEAKRHLRVTTDDDDQLVRDYLRAATEYCEDQVPGARSFSQCTWDWKIHAFPDDIFEIPRPPLQSVTHIKYYATASSTGLTTLSSTAYIVNTPTSAPGSVELHPNDGAWPTVADRADAIHIRFVSGYSNVPEQAKQAIKMIVGHYYNNREAVLTGTVSKEIEHGVRALLGSIGYGDYS